MVVPPLIAGNTAMNGGSHPIKGLQIYGKRKGIARLADIVGKAADTALPSGALPTVPRTAYPWERSLK